MRIRGLAPALASLFVTTLSAFAAIQTLAQQPVFRSRADLVQVDVVAMGADGRPIHSLTKNDFTLLDDGVPRPIAAFSEVSHERHDRLPIGGDVFDNASENDRVVIV